MPVMNRAADRLELVADPVRRTGRTLLSAGVEQSYVDVEDPRHLHFEYVRRIASAVEVAAPADHPVSVLHLGGGALTLPAGWPPPDPAPRNGSSSGTPRWSRWSPGVATAAPEVRVEVADARDALTATRTASTTW
ncbi:hypothetical protein NKG94_12770 [Micromonospora sp. M12]